MATKTPKTTKPAKGGTPVPAKRAAAKTAAAPQAKRKPGRPSIHTPALAKRVCELLMHGKSLRSICAMDSMPSMPTVLSWIHDDKAGFSAQYARAREVQAEVLADDVIQLADTTLHAVKRTVKGKGKNKEVEEVFGDAVDRSRLMVEARKWYAGKVAPKKFGERLQVDPAEGASLVVFKDLTGRKDTA